MLPAVCHDVSPLEADASPVEGINAALAELFRAREWITRDATTDGCASYALAKVDSAAAYLLKDLRAYFHDRPQVTSEQHAMALLKGLAMELQMAAQALELAARQLKNSGHGVRASRAHEAAVRAMSAADGYLG